MSCVSQRQTMDVTRDPTSYELYGTNAAILSLPNSDGTAEAWTLISSGPLSLPTARLTPSAEIPINSPANYTSYKLIFPTNGGSTLFQIGDIQFYVVPEPSTLVLVAMGLALIRSRRGRN